MEDRIRVYRILEYKGSRSMVESVIDKSIHGTKKVNDNLSITVETLGEFPETAQSPFDSVEETFLRKILTERKIELNPSIDNLEENIMIVRLLDKLS